MRASRVKVAIAGAAVAVVAFAGVAHAGVGSQDRIQQKLKDGSCLTTVAAGDQDRVRLQDPIHDRIQQQLKDGSCLV